MSTNFRGRGRGKPDHGNVMNINPGMPVNNGGIAQTYSYPPHMPVPAPAYALASVPGVDSEGHGMPMDPQMYQSLQNPTLHAGPNAMLTSNSGHFTLNMANQQQNPSVQQQSYAPRGYEGNHMDAYQQQYRIPTNNYYQPHQPIPMPMEQYGVQQMNNPVSHMQNLEQPQPTVPAQPLKIRERKVLTIVNPDTHETVCSANEKGKEKETPKEVAPTTAAIPAAPEPPAAEPVVTVTPDASAATEDKPDRSKLLKLEIIRQLKLKGEDIVNLPQGGSLHKPVSAQPPTETPTNVADIASAVVVPSSVDQVDSVPRNRNISISKEVTPVKEVENKKSKEATPVEKLASPVEKETTPVKKETTPVEKETTPVEKRTTPVEKEATPVEKEATPVEKVTNPVKKEPTPEDIPISREVSKSKEATPVKTVPKEENSVSDESPPHPVPASVESEVVQQPDEVITEEPSSSPVLDEPEDTEDPELKEARLLQEAEERRREQTRELESRLAEMTATKEECDPEQCVYGRQFLHAVRDIEKDQRLTPCPLTDKQLEDFGLDVKSMPKMSEKRRTDFAPPWSRNTQSSQQHRNKYSGRTSDRGGGGGRGGNRKAPPGRMSIERPSQRDRDLLKKAENAWKAEKIKPEDMEDESNRLKVVLKSIRALLNKITPTTKDALIKEFMAFNVSYRPDGTLAEEQLQQVIEIIFDKAVEENKFCAIYSEVCRRQVDFEAHKATASNTSKIPFRDALLKTAQQTFIHSKDQEAIFATKKQAVEEEQDEKKKLEMAFSVLQEETKFRRRKFGNIAFIGHLFKQQLLSTGIIQWCISDLLRHTNEADTKAKSSGTDPVYDEESLHCAVQLMEGVGQLLEKDVQKHGVEYAKSVLNRFKEISPHCTNKIRFMIMNLVDMSNNRWQQRKVVDQGPKKISEIHKQVQKEQLEKQMEQHSRDRGMRMGGNSMRGPGGQQKHSIPSRNSYDARMSVKKTEQDRRNAAATSSKLVATTVQPKNLSLAQADSRNDLGGRNQSKWTSGAGGGGSTDSMASRAPASQPWGARRVKESERKNSRDEKADAVNAARAMGNSAGKLSVQRTSSQLSVASQETESISEDVEAAAKERMESVEKMAKFLSSDVSDLLSGEVTMDELVGDVVGRVGNAKFNAPTLDAVFESFAFAAVECVKPDEHQKRQTMGELLHKSTAKVNKDLAMKGLAVYITNLNEGIYDVSANVALKRLSELLVCSMFPSDAGDHAVGLTLNDFREAILASTEDPVKPHDFLVSILQRMAEEIHKKMSNVDDIRTFLSMTFEELSVLPQLDRAALDEVLRKTKPTTIDSCNSLLDLLKQ